MQISRKLRSKQFSSRDEADNCYSSYRNSCLLHSRSKTCQIPRIFKADLRGQKGLKSLSRTNRFPACSVRGIDVPNLGSTYRYHTALAA